MIPRPTPYDAEQLITAGIELAEHASYAETSGGVTVNQPQIRELCNRIFEIRRRLDTALQERRDSPPMPEGWVTGPGTIEWSDPDPEDGCQDASLRGHIVGRIYPSPYIGKTGWIVAWRGGFYYDFPLVTHYMAHPPQSADAARAVVEAELAQTSLYDLPGRKPQPLPTPRKR